MKYVALFLGWICELNCLTSYEYYQDLLGSLPQPGIGVTKLFSVSAEQNMGRGLGLLSADSVMLD